jgi:glutathionylspermidine synthase
MAFGKGLLGRRMRYGEMGDSYQAFLRLKQKGKKYYILGSERVFLLG